MSEQKDYVPPKDLGHKDKVEQQLAHETQSIEFELSSSRNHERNQEQQQSLALGSAVAPTPSSTQDEAQVTRDSDQAEGQAQGQGGVTGPNDTLTQGTGSPVRVTDEQIRQLEQQEELSTQQRLAELRAEIQQSQDRANQPEQDNGYDPSSGMSQ